MNHFEVISTYIHPAIQHAIHEYNFFLQHVKEQLPGHFHPFQPLRNDTSHTHLMSELQRFLFAYQGVCALAQQELSTVGKLSDMEDQPSEAFQILINFFERFNPELQYCNQYSNLIRDLVDPQAQTMSVRYESSFIGDIVRNLKSIPKIQRQIRGI